MTEAQEVIRAVNRAEEVLEGLKVRGELRTSPGGLAATPATSRPPVDLAMMDLAHHIEQLFHGWARLLHEDAGVELPNGNHLVPDWLRTYRDQIAQAGWAPDMVDELEAAARKGIGMLGLLPKRTPLPEPCAICESRQWVYHERPPFVRCQQEHESQLVEHLQGRGTEVITHADAAWILGVGRTAITMAIARGLLDAGDDGGVTIASVRARLANVPV